MTPEVRASVYGNASQAQTVLLKSARCEFR